MGEDYSEIAFKYDGRLKLLIIVGTRPEVIRLSEVIKKCRRHFDCLLAHTGQNYDYTLNGIFFRDLSLGDPDVYLDAVGADLGVRYIGGRNAGSLSPSQRYSPSGELRLLIGKDSPNRRCCSMRITVRLRIPHNFWRPCGFRKCRRVSRRKTPDR